MSAAAPRLWVISDIYHPEDVSTGYYMTHIAEGLAGVADVHILCGRPSYAARQIKVARKEHRNGTSITRLGLFAFPKDRLALRLLNVIGFTTAVAWFLLFHLRPGDRVLNVTNPPVVPPLAAAIAKWRGAKFVLLVHDVFPETAVAAGLLSAKSVIFRIASFLVNSAYKSADAVVVLGRDMALLATAKRGRADGIAIIENWADLDEVTPQPTTANPYLSAKGWTEKSVVQVSGNLGRTHDIEALTLAAKRMSSDQRWCFLFAGFGGKQHIALQAVNGSSNSCYIERQPRQQLGNLLAASSVHVIAFVPGMLGLSVPSRMYNVLAAGRPIIAMAEPETELALTVLEEGVGWQVDPGDIDGLVALLNRITHEDCLKKGIKSRSVAERRFSYDSVIARFVKVLELGETANDA